MEEMKEFKFQGKRFAFAKLVDPMNNASWDIIAIFEVIYNDSFNCDEYKFVNYVYGASQVDDAVDVVKMCMPYIEDYALNLNVLPRRV